MFLTKWHPLAGEAIDDVVEEREISHARGPLPTHDLLPYCRPHDCQIFWSSAPVSSGDPVKMP
jgi:hypothetical protein